MEVRILLLLILCARSFAGRYGDGGQQYVVTVPVYDHVPNNRGDYSPQPIYVPDPRSGQRPYRSKEPENDYSPQPFLLTVQQYGPQQYGPQQYGPQQYGPQPYAGVSPRSYPFGGYQYPSVYPKIPAVQGPTLGQPHCQNQTFGRGLYSVAEKQGAAATGIVGGSGITYAQNFNTNCPQAGKLRYRTYDGTCNHPKNLGASFTPFARLLPPQYDDGYGLPRQTSVYGGPLPSPRTISSYIHSGGNSYMAYTHMLMQWGQWLDHDMSAIAVASDRRAITCCPNGTNTACARHPDCYPIVIPKDEKYFVGRCMEFVRATAATDSYGRPLRNREQVNTVNAFVDASMVYGATSERAALLRERGEIYMRTKGGYPPESTDNDCVKRPNSSDYCFLTGDIRTHENPALTVMHVTWLREHNRMADELQQLKPKASKDEIFETVRRIIGAMHQVISCNEYLPIIFGRDAIRLGLTSKKGRSKYNPKLDPRVTNVFSSAAMRFGHSSIPSVYIVGDKVIPLRETFSRPAVVLDDFEGFIRGLVGITPNRERAIQAVDRSFVEEVTNHLFEPANGGPGKGLDLVSLNIQRGRDHGLASYTRWRKYCGLRPLYGFNDTEALGPYASKLAAVYKSIHDIDLFTGLVHEPVDEGLIGPTFRCLLGEQFVRTKYGDRFFFDNDEPYTSFTDEQLYELRRTTLSKVICLNTNIEALPLSSFMMPGSSNPMVPCAKLRAERLNLSLFI